MQFSWIDIKLVFSYNTKIPILWAQNGPKIPLSSNNSSETHRNYWIPYIKIGFYVSYRLWHIGAVFMWFKLVSATMKNPYFGAQSGPKITFFSINSSETIRNYWKIPIGFYDRLWHHWCGFHELILNWYSATTQKFLFWGPIFPKFHYPVITAQKQTETIENPIYRVFNRFLRSIMTHWCNFHELI